MKLSELKPESFKVIDHGAQEESSGPLKLSSLKPEQIKVIPEAPKGVDVYDEPVGPEQANYVDRVKARLQDPDRWKAALLNEGPYAKRNLVQGDAPMVIPGGAIPMLGRAATALNDGKTIAAALGRVGLSGAQGAAMSAAGGKEGESWKDKLDRIEHGGKLSAGIQIAAESLPVVGKVLGYAGRKIGSALSGVEESLIQNYAKRTDEVNDMIRQSGGDITEAADQVRRDLSEGIQSTKTKLNGQVTKAVESAPTAKTFDLKPILDPLEKQHAALLSSHQTEEANQIAGIIEKVKKFGHEGDAVYGVGQYAGRVNAKELNQIKGLLQDIATPAYDQSGQIFNYAKASQRAAKYGAAQARKGLNAAIPEVAEANNQLSAMHRIEENLNRNLLTEGKSDSALMAAGSGANPRNAKMLGRLGEIAGVDASSKAKDLATARAFSNPSLNPADWNGKAAARVLLGSGIGTAAAGPAGAALGAVVASPMAIKAGVNIANSASKVASKLALPGLGEFARKNPVAAQTIVQLVSGQIRRANEPNPIEVSPEVEQYFRENPKLLQNVTDPKMRAEIEKRVSRGPAQSLPKAGPDRWASDGASKLGLSPEQSQSLMQSKEGKQLLIEASGLSPGSAAMKRIQERIQKIGGAK